MIFPLSCLVFTWPPTIGKANTGLPAGAVAGPVAWMLMPASVRTAAVSPSSFSRVFPPVTAVVALRSALLAGGAESARASSAAASAAAIAVKASELLHVWRQLDAPIVVVLMWVFASLEPVCRYPPAQVRPVATSFPLLIHV